MDVDKVEEKAPAIDDALYSRQLYVFGHQAQAKLGSSNVLIVGLKGLGVEIAKNVILAGVKSVALLDNDPVEIRDLGAQFYLTEQHVGKPRAACSVDQLASLNPYVNTYVVSEPLNEALLSKYTVVVLTGRPVAEQVQINKFCHANGIKTVVADIFGLGAAVFVDVGEQHVIEDPSGEQPARGLITHISQGNPGVVTVHEDKRHGLETGMWVTFEEVEGMTQLNNTPPRQIKVISPFSFSIEDTTGYSEYKGEGYFQQVNVPISLKHQTLEAALANVTGVITWDVFGHALPMHVLYQAISAFRGKHGGAFPSPTQPEHAQEAVALAKEYAATAKVDVQFDAKTEKMLLQLARCSGASLSPMAAFVGGFAGQEVLKACSGKFTPLTQLLYFDAAEALPADDLAAGEYAPQNHRYDDQIAVFGRTFQQTLSDQAYFLVGAGAIGCEMLKNWALMGVATGGKGRIHVTDMDQIEKSNLNRQFLFRAGDVGKLKSETAAGAVQKMNPACRVDAAAERVGPGTEHIYDDAFWESLSACVTALDNVDARLYCDQRCLYYQKPMVDSGTLGTKGNTQVVLPRLTESYGASRDPPEESIPICTLKNFPNKIEHTIQWARDTFEGWFRQAVEDVNSYLSKPTYLAELAKQPNTQLDSLKNIHNYLVTERPLTFEDCVKWARLKFEELFNHTVLQLLHNFPEDSVTSTGTKFWSGTKRAPAALLFNPQDSEHINFVIAAANLRAFNYGLKGDSNPDAIRNVLAGVNVPPFQPKSVKIATSEAEAKEQAANSGDDDLTVKVKELEGQLPAPASMAGYTLHPSIFEKDDDTNFHMAFVTACSNLRARNYRIKEQNIHQTKFIAGKIIPAIATTTAAVTGLVCLELYKIIQNKPLEAYRNTFINLALPLVTGSEPTPPKTQVAKLKTGEWKWSSWDRIEINEGDITLQQLFNIFKERYGLVASMVSFGSSLLFMGLPGMKSKHADRLNMKLSEIIKNVAKVELKPKEKYVALEICVSGEEDDEDVEIPYVRVNLRG